jgi:threonine dehydrogenase-like Zn-dependent dehydrogenase
MREAFMTDRPGGFEIRECDDAPAPGPGEVQIRVRACGICGSDLHGMRDPDRWNGGRRPGHEIAGEVVATGEGVDRWTVGDRAALQPNLFCGECATCLSGRIEICERGFTVIGLTLPGGYTELLTVPQRNLHRMPDGMDFALGAMTEPLAVVVHGYRMAAEAGSGRTTTGERIVVLGGGIIGLLAVFYARQSGAGEIAITARYEQQANAARQLGATHVFAADEPGEHELRRWSLERPVDLVIETVGGSGEVLPLAMDVSRRGGRILILGVFDGQAAMPMQQIIGKGTRIIGSLMYGYAGQHADYDMAIELERRFGDVLGNLITHRVPLEEIERGFALAVDKSSGAIKVTVEP